MRGNQPVRWKEDFSFLMHFYRFFFFLYYFFGWYCLLGEFERPDFFFLFFFFLPSKIVSQVYFFDWMKSCVKVKPSLYIHICKLSYPTPNFIRQKWPLLLEWLDRKMNIINKNKVYYDTTFFSISIGVQ